MAFDPAGLTRDFGDIEGEARACRDDCALFDFSFMARGRVRGARAVETIERLQPRPMADLAPGRIRYALRLDPGGAVAADLTVWRLAGGIYEVMSGRREDIAALAALAPAGVEVEDMSGAAAVLAVQGPRTLEAFEGLTDLAAVAALPYFGCAALSIGGVPCLVGRLGYTGEKGFEVLAPIAAKTMLREALAKRARPAGFAAADILRIEAGFMLFANECRIAPTPSELGLADFADGQSERNRMTLVCFEAKSVSRPILWRPPARVERPRPGEIAITSACHSVVADVVLGLGFVVSADNVTGNGGDIAVRDPNGTFTGIRLVSLPFYDTNKVRPRGHWLRHSRPN